MKSNPKYMRRMNSVEKKWRSHLELDSRDDFEIKAHQSWRRSYRGAKTSELSKVCAQKNRILVGDHRLSPRQVSSWLSVFSPKVHKYYRFITDRFEQKHHKLIRKFIKGQASMEALQDALDIAAPHEQAPEGGLLLVLAWLAKHQIQIDLIAPTHSPETQKNELYQRMNKYQKSIVWTGSLKVAPIWHPQHELEDFVMIRADGLTVFNDPKNAWCNQGPYWIVNRDDRWVNYEMSRLWSDHQSMFIVPDDLEKAVGYYFKLYEKTFQTSFMPSPKLEHPFGRTFYTHLSKKTLNHDFIRKRMYRWESVVMPSMDMMLICRLDPASIAEEAMHYFRMHAWRKKSYGPWVSIWEEAWGMFGSLMVNPEHVFEHSEHQNSTWKEIHQHGYQLGQLLFQGWQVRKTRSLVREMFSYQSTNEQEAKGFVANAKILLWDVA